MREISAWGRYPKTTGVLKYFAKESECIGVTSDNEYIPCGNFRSYGDCALSETMMSTLRYDKMLHFDEERAILHVQSGVILKDIVDCFVPRGYFLNVVPGTQLITVGGAIAADVHGKNHHVAGCFSEHVIELKLLLPNGKTVECSQKHNRELFLLTCGGMGLSGVILDAKIELKKINSKNIAQTTIKTSSLRETFDTFEKHKDKPYSVAWIDCLSSGDSLGRSLVMYGDFRDDGDLDYNPSKIKSIPFDFPGFALNKYSVKAFNELYYNGIKDKESEEIVSLEKFFFPLDSMYKWNRIYGKEGFLQYQIIFPLENSFVALQEILQKISNAGKGSFLAVLKLYGAENENYLSFPIEGYSLALDFKMEEGIFEFLNTLDDTVLKFKGRTYLAKDARVTKEVFEQGYSRLDIFKKERKKIENYNNLVSLQSKRLGL